MFADSSVYGLLSCSVQKHKKVKVYTTIGLGFRVTFTSIRGHIIPKS